MQAQEQTVTQWLMTKLTTLQQDLRDREWRYHRVGTTNVIVYPHGIKVLDEHNESLTRRAVGPELAAVLIATS